MTDTIRQLNDAFRASLITPKPLGKLYATAGVEALGPGFVAKVIAAMVSFNGFTADNDPHGEHDLVTVVVDGTAVWGKIDYYSADDPDLGADDPADSTMTERVMTLLLPEEY